MNSFEEIIEDIKWREEQLLICKTLPYLYSFSESQKAFLIKSSILNIYAIWEGFVQTSFQTYVRELNRLGLQRDQICFHILTHSVDASFPQLKEYPKEFIGRKKFVCKLDNYFNQDFIISSIINTESNVELEVLNRIMNRFDLKLIESYPYKQELKNLLWHRNRIAHGDISLVINDSNIDEFKDRIDGFVLTVKNLMAQVNHNICDGFFVRKSHLRN